MEEVIDEECDDSNLNDDDGCSSECKIELNHTCPIEGKLCEPACGNTIVDGAIPGYPNYNEDCDPFILKWDANRETYTRENHSDYINIGCHQYTCKYEAPKKDYYYGNSDGRFGARYVEEEYYGRYGAGGTGSCVTDYMIGKMKDTDEYPHYKGTAGDQKCFQGKYCLDCDSPRFPGYPLSDLYSFTDPTPYSNLATPYLGRLRAMSLNDDALAFSFVLNNKDVLVLITLENVYIADDKGKFTNLTEFTNIEELSIPTTLTSSDTIKRVDHTTAAMRQTFGKHFVASKGTNEIRFYTLEVDSETSGTITIDGASVPTKKITYKFQERPYGAPGATMRSIPTQLGAEFYIWWPGPDLLLSRLYNQRNFELIPFNNKTYDSFASTSGIDKELLLDYSHVPNFEIIGDIVADPVFHKGLMYVPLKYISNAPTPDIEHYVDIYSTENLPWEVTRKEHIKVNQAILSIASFVDGVMITCEGHNFYKISGSAAIGITPTHNNKNCDMGSYFVQARPSPDVPNESFPVYYFCHKYEIMNATLVGAALTLDSANKIRLPEDDKLPIPYNREHYGKIIEGAGNARFNLNYPYDLSGPFLINFGVYKTSMETGYLHEHWRILDLSYINLMSGYSRHFKITIDENLLDPHVR